MINQHMISRFKRVFDRIYYHPFHHSQGWRPLIRFFWWQVRCLVSKRDFHYTFTEHTRLVLRKGMTGATGNLYCGLIDFYEMGFLLHFLRPEDLFADVGANVGVYSILASGEKGAQSVAFEPVPETMDVFRENIRLNNLEGKIKALQMGIGAKSDSLHFHQDLGINNRVQESQGDSDLKVKVDSIDACFLDRPPTLLKIDVEGYEQEVIQGAKNTLADPGLQAIIIELIGLGRRYGWDENEIHKQILSYGFEPVAYDPLKRKIIKLETYGGENTIYVRDVHEAQDRVRRERKVLVGPGRRAL